MFANISRIVRFIRMELEPVREPEMQEPSDAFKHLPPGLAQSVIAQKREDFDAMRAYQSMLLADFQQFVSIIQNSVVGVGFIFVSTAGALVSIKLNPVIASAIALIVTALFYVISKSLFTSYNDKILRDCEIYSGHRDRYLIQVRLLGLYEPHQTGSYGSIAPCLDKPFSARAGKGTEQTLSLIKLINKLAVTFVFAGCLLTISVAFNDRIGRCLDEFASQVRDWTAPTSVEHQKSR